MDGVTVTTDLNGNDVPIIAPVLLLPTASMGL